MTVRYINPFDDFLHDDIKSHIGSKERLIVTVITVETILYCTSDTPVQKRLLPLLLSACANVYSSYPSDPQGALPAHLGAEASEASGASRAPGPGHVWPRGARALVRGGRVLVVVHCSQPASPRKQRVGLGVFELGLTQS